MGKCARITRLFAVLAMLFAWTGNAGAVTVRTIGYNDQVQAVFDRSGYDEVIEAEDLVRQGRYSGSVIVAPSPYQYMIWMYGPGAKLFGTFTKECNVIAVQFASSDTNDGIARIFVDGSLAAELDSMSQGSWYVEISDIPLGKHSVTIEAQGNASGQDDLHIDAIAVRTQGCTQPPAGMTGWWPGDGNANDIIGSNSGVLQGNVTYAQGKVADAFSFNGQGYVSVPDNDLWTLGSDPFTVDLWVKFNSLSGRDPFVAHDENGGYYNKWIFWYDAYAASYGHSKGCNGPALAFHINGPGVGGTDPICAPWLPETGRWYQVAVTRSGSTYSLYIDGVLVKTATDSNSIPNPNFPLTIGRAEAYLLNGQIDELEIFKRALSAAEIQAIYFAGSAGKCKPVNRAPVANAGPDRTIECAGPDGSALTLDGSGSSDPDNDTLTYTWTWPGGSASGVNPTVTLPYGVTTVTLSVDDGKGGTATDDLLVTVQDSTPPATTASVAGVTGQNGWYVSDVTVTLNSTDTCTGVKEIHYTVNGVETVVNGNTADFTLSQDGSYVVTYWAVDNAGREGEHNTTPVNRDTAPPATVATPSGTQGNGGYYTSCVNVTLQTSTGASGVERTEYSLDGGQTWQVYTGGFELCPTQGSPVTATVTYRSVSGAGNAEQPKTLVINIDKTAPVITASVSPAPNANGWNNTDATVTFTCSDNGSGIASCTPAVTVTTEGAGQVITGTATDKAGNTATTSVTLNIDKTAPLITASVSPAPNAYGWHNSDVTVTFTCSDALSGIAILPGPGYGNRRWRGTVDYRHVPWIRQAIRRRTR